MTNNASEKPAVAVLGALAYDRIATTQTPFEPNGPGLNCKVSATTEHLGGCGGNLAYHLSGLQQSTLLISASGSDDIRYQAALQSYGADLCGLYRDTNASCATAYIITDPQGQQFTAFHSGPEVTPAVWVQHLESVGSKLIDCKLLLCAPFPPELMLGTMAFMREHNPSALVVWAPGQFTDQMDAGMLNACSSYADWLVVNEHEAEHIRAHAPEIFLSKTAIITNGAAAVQALLDDGNIRRYPVAKITPVVDPTGSGDAFTAGLVSQLIRDTTQPLTYLDAAIEAGTKLARQCLSHYGAQPSD